MSQVNRRKHQRRLATGTVDLWWQDATPRETRGSLIDVSEGGFRAAHNNPGLAAGQEVRFRHAAAAGRARVIWTRVVPGAVESGLLVLAVS